MTNLKAKNISVEVSVGTVEGVPILSKKCYRELRGISNNPATEETFGDVVEKYPNCKTFVVLFNQGATVTFMTVYLEGVPSSHPIFKIKPAELVSQEMYSRYEGTFPIGELEKNYSSSVYDIVSEIYVPISSGSNNSIIPCLWSTNASSSDSITFDKPLVDDNGLNKENINEMAKLIKETYPSVNLPEQEDIRYVNFTYRGRKYCYNRNHVAFNGSISNVDLLMPIILKSMNSGDKEVKESNILKYLDGSIFEEDIIIKFNDGPLVPEDEMPKPQFHKNPLINAAMKSGSKA